MAAGRRASRRGCSRASRCPCGGRSRLRPGTARATCTSGVPSSAAGARRASAAAVRAVAEAWRSRSRGSSTANAAPARRRSGTRNTLSGLRSRWTMPFACAAPSASAICRATEHARRAPGQPALAREPCRQRLALEELHDDVRAARSECSRSRRPRRCPGAGSRSPRASLKKRCDDAPGCATARAAAASSPRAGRCAGARPGRPRPCRRRPARATMR